MAIVRAVPFLLCLMLYADNAEMQQIYETDQKERAAPVAKLKWEEIGPRDAARRARVRALIGQGLLVTGKDYERAAMVFQHGTGTEDILLAHVLAVTALGKGNRDARWLAAATLDRYLQRSGHPQVFGTQYMRAEEKKAWTQEPYNASLVGPLVRDANCVPDREHQKAVVAALNRGQEPPEPKRSPCADK